VTGRAVARMRRGLLPLAASLVLAPTLGLVVSPQVTAAGTLSFDPPTGTAVLLQPLAFRDTFRSDVAPSRVELITSSPYVAGATVEDVAPTRVAGGTWQVTVSQPDTGSANTVYRFAFRVTLPGGVTATSPSGTLTVTDQRFAWKSISGATVTLHWYAESRSIAQAWLATAESAVRRASAAFGVTSVAHLDFFIYDRSQPFFDAIGSGANADAAGVYIPETHTAFGTVLASDLGSSWPDTEIAHEVTHHVFEIATHNAYHAPPFWLDEGLAVYYSEGIGPRRADLQQGISQGLIIPLDGLSGTFPSSTDSFVLSYAEAVSAVDFFLRQYGQAALTRLLAAYARGATDDEAFTAATHGTAAAFDAAWLTSIGVHPPPAYGPRPAPPGPVPAGWPAPAAPGSLSALALLGVASAVAAAGAARRSRGQAPAEPHAADVHAADPDAGDVA
jgi:Peptidase MA superfamily